MLLGIIIGVAATLAVGGLVFYGVIVFASYKSGW